MVRVLLCFHFKLLFSVRSLRSFFSTSRTFVACVWSYAPLHLPSCFHSIFNAKLILFLHFFSLSLAFISSICERKHIIRLLYSILYSFSEWMCVCAFIVYVRKMLVLLLFFIYSHLREVALVVSCCKPSCVLYTYTPQMLLWTHSYSYAIKTNRIKGKSNMCVFSCFITPLKWLKWCVCSACFPHSTIQHCYSICFFRIHILFAWRYSTTHIYWNTDRYNITHSFQHWNWKSHPICQ